MHKRGIGLDSLLLILVATAALLGVLLAGAATTSAEVITGLDPESGATTCPAGYGLEDFESGTDGYRWGGAPIASTIPGVQFVTTEGQDWWTGDWAAEYNGKYPDGAYTSGGQKWAWLGVSHGAGIIDFTEGEASYVSVYTSTFSGLVLEAYTDDDVFLESSGWASNNIRTGTMPQLSISRPTADIGYVIVHDTGNYWLIDWLCTDAPGVLPADPTIEEQLLEKQLLEKQLLAGPEQIGIHLPAPTQYVFEIAYSNPDSATPVRIVDTVPAEFEIVSVNPSDGTAVFFDPSRGRGNSANRIEWDLPVGTTTATLTVEIQTVASPGRGHRATVFKPTQCGPLSINDGATAFEVDPATGEIVRVIMGPSNALEVEAVEGAKPCVEVEEEE